MGLSGTRFTIRRRLGEGGMGVVYEAFDEDRRVAVALKTLRHFDGMALARFKREFRALSGLSHPNLVALDELFVEDNNWFFTMELVVGVDFVCYARGGLRASRIGLESTVHARTDWSQVPESGIVAPQDRSVLFDEWRLR